MRTEEARAAPRVVLPLAEPAERDKERACAHRGGLEVLAGIGIDFDFRFVVRRLGVSFVDGRIFDDRLDRRLFLGHGFVGFDRRRGLGTGGGILLAQIVEGQFILNTRGHDRSPASR
ncbi:MAG: hypothetical protein ABW128_07465 [Rhizorhabdus sp.]